MIWNSIHVFVNCACYCVCLFTLCIQFGNNTVYKFVDRVFIKIRNYCFKISSHRCCSHLCSSHICCSHPSYSHFRSSHLCSSDLCYSHRVCVCVCGSWTPSPNMQAGEAVTTGGFRNSSCASAKSRARVTSMAAMCSATKPLMLRDIFEQHMSWWFEDVLCDDHEFHMLEGSGASQKLSNVAYEDRLVFWKW